MAAKKQTPVKTLLLENNTFLWSGLDEFCKSFDPNYQEMRTSPRNHDIEHDYRAVAMLAQPSIERLIVASAFEGRLYLPYIEKNEEYWQIEHYLNLIWNAFRVSENLNPNKKLYVEINYHGPDFLRSLKEDNWGNQFTRSISTFVRQNPDNLIVNIYKNYQFQYRLTEANMYDE